MRKQLFSFFVLAFFTQLALAQTSSLKGIVVDSIENKNLQNSVISLLRVKDSVLVKFTRADKSGKFSISNLKEGQYIVMITHPLLGDYFDKTAVAAGTVNDLGKIFMIPKVNCWRK